MKLTADEVVKKAIELAKIEKDHSEHMKLNQHKLITNPELCYPEYYPGYRTVCNQYDRILVHSMYGVFPDHLFITRAPNMEQKEFDYIKGNYKQITLPVFIDYNNTVYKCFNDGNWNITIPETLKEGEDSFEKYVNEKMGIYHSLETWMKTITIPCKSRDAMGVIAIKPNYVYKESVDESGQESYSVDDSKRPEPLPYYYNCKQVLTKATEKYTVILLDEKSYVTYGNKREKSGMIFEFYDDGAIWTVEQYGKKLDLNFVIKKVEQTGLEYSSVAYLMGNPMVREGCFIYESPFLYAVDILDLMATTQSYVQASEAKCVFPFRIMVGNECDFNSNGRQCVDGHLVENAQKVGICMKCKGSGMKTRISALGEMIISPDEAKELDLDKVLKYVSPEVKTLEFLDNKILKYESNARAILHMGQTNTEKTQGSGTEDTASGKWIDQKNHHAFIKPISDQIFYLYEFTINTMAKMRHPETDEKVVVTAPISFEFNTEEDYINQITAMRDAGLPDAMIYPVIYKFLSSVYYTDSKTMAIFLLLVNADRLLLMSNENINNGIANKTVLPWEKYLHDSAIVLLNELIMGDEKFLDKEMKEKIEALQNLAQEKAPAVAAPAVAAPVNLFS